jgi:hypothetical protein
VGPASPNRAPGCRGRPARRGCGGGARRDCGAAGCGQGWRAPTGARPARGEPVPGSTASRRARWGRTGRRPSGRGPGDRGRAGPAARRLAGRARGATGRTSQGGWTRRCRRSGCSRRPATRGDGPILRRRRRRGCASRRAAATVDARGVRDHVDHRGRPGSGRRGREPGVPAHARPAHARPAHARPDLRRRGRPAAPTTVVAKRSASILHDCGGASGRLPRRHRPTNAPAGRWGKTIHACARTVHRGGPAGRAVAAYSGGVVHARQ